MEGVLGLLVQLVERPAMDAAEVSERAQQS